MKTYQIAARWATAVLVVAATLTLISTPAEARGGKTSGKIVVDAGLRGSGLDDAATHDPNDDRGGARIGNDDPAGHDANDSRGRNSGRRGGGNDDGASHR